MSEERASTLRGNRLPSLTGMRFIAALLVFLCHASVKRMFADQNLDDQLFVLFGRAGWTGVEFFFILSGFVLTWSARPDDTLLSFWRRRAAKIYPNNVVTWLLAVVLLAWSGQVITARVALPNLFLVQSWRPDMAIFGGVNPPSWSLCCEVLFYASFPALLWAIRKIPGRRLWLTAAAIVVAVLILPVVARALPPQPLFPVVHVSFPQFWFVYAFPLTRMLDFALGIVVARLVIDGRWPRIGLAPAAALALACYAYTVVAPVLYSMTATMVVPLALVIGAAATADLNGSRSPTRGRVMVYLGEVSFAFYMIHVLVLTYGLKALGGVRWGVPGGVAVAVLLFAVALALGAALYSFVERPAMRYLGRARRNAPPDSDPAVRVPKVSPAVVE